ncbi:MAG: helix-turn-helix transcriptional regulator [Steroidobacteraceae bacterium]|nr:helix-turn-helix transcriptional regulator [Steroidobacteraceae bacterium]MDW8258393.1 helix-turn-helix domain-containing protein [Gammaproteobacteria bacterium]
MIGKASKKTTPRSRGGADVRRMLEDIVGCKWSLSVLELVSRGVARPGAMQRSIAGLSAKVLNERLRKLLRYGIIEREVFAEVPPHVEYRLTKFGRRFEQLLQQIEQLQASLTDSGTARR